MNSLVIFRLGWRDFLYWRYPYGLGWLRPLVNMLLVWWFRPSKEAWLAAVKEALRTEYPRLPDLLALAKQTGEDGRRTYVAMFAQRALDNLPAVIRQLEARRRATEAACTTNLRGHLLWELIACKHGARDFRTHWYRMARIPWYRMTPGLLFHKAYRDMEEEEESIVFRRLHPELYIEHAGGFIFRPSSVAPYRPTLH